jgi:hypothetical protein
MHGINTRQRQCALQRYGASTSAAKEAELQPGLLPQPQLLAYFLPHLSKIRSRAAEEFRGQIQPQGIA